MNDRMRDFIMELEKRVSALERQLASRIPRKDPSLMDLKDILEAKERLAAEIRNKHYAQAALGGHWDKPEHQKEYAKLKKEAGELLLRIASYGG